MKNILITGASGFIGRHLVNALGEHSVWAVVGEHDLPRADNVIQLRHDLSGTELPAALPKKIDVVIHLAQARHFRDFPDRARETFSVNVAATVALLDWAWVSGARTFILASSGGLYGGGTRSFDETEPLAPTGPLGFYLASKHCAELLAENYVTFFNVIALRFFFVYGPGQNRTMLIPRLVDNISAGRPVTLSGADGIRINPIYVDDAVAAVVSAMSLESSEKINIAGPETRSLRSISNLIGDLAGVEPIFSVEDAASPRDLVGDTAKMARLLLPPVTTLREGLRTVFIDSVNKS